MAFVGVTLTNIYPGQAQEAKANSLEITLQTTPDSKGGQSATESTQQLQARKEIISLCETLATQDDTAQLQPLYTEDAFKTQCGEWILMAVDISSHGSALEDSEALESLKKFVKENKLDELDLDAIFADDESMFGGKIVVEAY